MDGQRQVSLSVHCDATRDFSQRWDRKAAAKSNLKGAGLGGRFGIEAWVTLAVVAAVLISLLKEVAPTDVLFIGATTLLAAVRIISPEEAFAGFSNSGMLTVAFLFIVVAGLRETARSRKVRHTENP